MALQHQFVVAAAAALFVLGSPSVQAGQDPCEPNWNDAFVANKGASGTIRAFAEFDDGTGPALYIGGAFAQIAGVTVNGLARWDGREWSPVFSGFYSANVHSLKVFDDGTGPALYIGGRFAQLGSLSTIYLLLKFDGQTVTPLAQTSIGGFFYIAAMAAFDHGEGPLLYLAGHFAYLEGTSAQSIAVWDGNSVTPLEAPRHWTPWAYYDAKVFDDGTGPAVYFGGGYAQPGSNPPGKLLRWDGRDFTEVADVNRPVSALSVVDDEGGSSLYVGGAFTEIDSVPLSHIARWDGREWHPVGGGLSRPVHALTIWDDGDGAALYAAGLSSFAEPASGIWRLDEAEWSAVGAGIKIGADKGAAIVRALAGHKGHLFAGGTFDAAGLVGARNLARWDGKEWAALISPGNGMSDQVNAFARFDGGAGSAIYAGGWFVSAGERMAYVARWSGETWEPVATSLTHATSPRIYAMKVFDDGSGPALYVGGLFGSIDGVTASNLARWDGASWSAVGNQTVGQVDALEIFDDGSGPALFVGGMMAGTLLTKWDGNVWTPIEGFNHRVKTLRVIDLGDGPNLFAGGRFTQAGGVSANHIARWDGTDWHPLGSGVSDGGNPYLRVYAIEAFDFGAGPHLFVGGSFDKAGGHDTPRLAIWNGQEWLPEAILPDNPFMTVHSLSRFDEGDGQHLIIGTVNWAFRWSGFYSGIQSMGLTNPGSVTFITALYSEFDLAINRPVLWIGGRLAFAEGIESANIAQRIGCLPAGFGDLNGDGSVGVGDLLILLAAWGPCPGSGPCPADLNGDGVVNLLDLLILLENWG